MKPKRIEKVAIVSRAGKPNIDKICGSVIDWLNEHNIKIVMPDFDARALKKNGYGCAEDELMNEVDLVVVLGGDGTILRVVRLLNGQEVPILGVNLGTFGFLAEVEVDNLIDALDKIKKGNYDIEARMTLTCEISSGAEKTVHSGLNEVFVGRANCQRLLEYDVRINGSYFGHIACDGIIVSSPTGSTAYSLSAGGPLVSPTNENLILLPVCPHSLFNRSLVLNASEEVQIVGAKDSAATAVTIDGIEIWRGTDFDNIKVRAGDNKVGLIRFGERHFYEILREKLKIFSTFSHDRESGG